jgi:hypothetical protein
MSLKLARWTRAASEMRVVEYALVLLLVSGITSSATGRSRPSTPRAALEHPHFCSRVLMLRGGDSGTGTTSTAKDVVSRAAPACEAPSGGNSPNQLEVGAWDKLNEIEWRHEPTSTDDWSTGEWAEATWRHFKTPEQIDRFVPDFSSDEQEVDWPSRDDEEAARRMPQGSRALSAPPSAPTMPDADSDLSDCVAVACEGAPLAGVDREKLHKEVLKYDISSDSDTYDDETSGNDGEGTEHLGTGGGGQPAREWMDQLIDDTIAAEDQIEQWHHNDPKSMGVLCRKEEWNATKYLNITPEQDAANRALWDACMENDVRACRRALEQGALADAANWVSPSPAPVCLLATCDSALLVRLPVRQPARWSRPHTSAHARAHTHNSSRPHLR